MNHPRQKNFLRGPGDVPPGFRDMIRTLAAMTLAVVVFKVAGLVWGALP